MMKEPEINVGIVNAQEIHFSLNGRFFAKGETVTAQIENSRRGARRRRDSSVRQIVKILFRNNSVKRITVARFKCKFRFMQNFPVKRFHFAFRYIRRIAGYNIKYT